jgi:molecular chaperone GrpE (heat shock protein)
VPGAHKNETIDVSTSKLKNRTDGSAADKEQEELKRKIAELENFLEEKNRHIRKQNATIREMKERQRSEINTSERRRKWRRDLCCKKSDI